MPAPVVSLSPSTTAATPSAGGAAGGLFSLLSGGGGTSLFGNLLATNGAVGARGIANVDVSTTTTASTDLNAKASMMLKGGTLMLFAQDGQDLSLDSLKSLLDSMGDASGELNTKILVAMTPGTPSTDIIENVKSQLAELGIDPSKVSVMMIKPSTDLPPPVTSLVTTATDAEIVTPAPLTIETSTAADASNFLLTATDLTPADMEPVKQAIKALVNEDGETVAVPSMDDGEPTDTDATTIDPALMVLVVFVPPVKQIEAPVTTDTALDISTLSAFTQPVAGDAEEPDWGKKLSDKLSNMAVPTGDDDASPFDDEMNAILSYDTDFKPAKSAEGFQGSISTTAEAKSAHADKMAAKAVAGEMSAQAAQLSGQSPLPAANAISSDGSLLYANGALMAAPQNGTALTNPVLNTASAAAAHPSVHAVASLIEKSASGSSKAKQELTVELDPPELGRMQIQLSLEKDGPMKVHLLAEKQDTLAMFQRDSHALKSALDQAGIQLDNGSLTFDLASGDQSFNQLLGGQQDNQSGAKTTHLAIAGDGSVSVADNMQMIDTKMDFRADSITGNVHYSFFA